MTTNTNLAMIELSESGVLSSYMSIEQRTFISNAIRANTGLSAKYAEGVLVLSERIRLMPATYETNFVDNNEKVIHLRYFKGSTTVWVIEKDKGSTSDAEQYQAFGYVDLYGHGLANAELGYINLEEITDAGMELDLGFEPTTYGELKKK